MVFRTTRSLVGLAGTFMLGFGFYGFDAGSAGEAHASRCTGKLGTARTIEIGTRHAKVRGREKWLGLRHKEVVLTFDDGPWSNTPRVLKALDDECVLATFFTVGRFVRMKPEKVRWMNAAGHSVAHHTWNHEWLPRLSDKAAGIAIDKGIRAVNRALYGIDSSRTRTPFFRYPYLARSKRTDRLLRRRGLIDVGANIDTEDYKSGSPAQLHDRIMRRLRANGRGIVLMHDTKTRTAKMLPRLLRSMKREGFKVVHIVPKGGVVVASGAAQSFGEPIMRVARATIPVPGATARTEWRVALVADAADTARATELASFRAPVAQPVPVVIARVETVERPAKPALPPVPRLDGVERVDVERVADAPEPALIPVEEIPTVTKSEPTFLAARPTPRPAYEGDAEPVVVAEKSDAVEKPVALEKPTVPAEDAVAPQRPAVIAEKVIVVQEPVEKPRLVALAISSDIATLGAPTARPTTPAVKPAASTPTPVIALRSTQHEVVVARIEPRKAEPRKAEPRKTEPSATVETPAPVAEEADAPVAVAFANVPVPTFRSSVAIRPRVRRASKPATSRSSTKRTASKPVRRKRSAEASTKRTKRRTTSTARRSTRVAARRTAVRRVASRRAFRNRFILR